MLKHQCVAISLLLGGAMACGADQPQAAAVVIPLETGEEHSSAPSITAVSPAVWTAGTTVRVIGSDFLPSTLGKVRLQLVGTVGGGPSVDMTVDAIYRSATRVEFVYEPEGQAFAGAIGTLDGKLTATNVSKRGGEARSQPYGAAIMLGKSILIDHLRPSSQTCARRRTTNVLNGDLVEVGVELTGVDAATAGASIVVRASYVDVLDQVRGVETAISEGTAATITIDPGMLSALHDDDESLNDARTSRDVGLGITATTGTGEVLRRKVVFTVRQELEVVYDGSYEVLDALEPQAVTGCLAGGPYGASFNYSESTEEERERELEIKSSFNVDVWLISVGFGFKVVEKARSSSSTSLRISHGVMPHWFGAFYRQTSQVLRTGDIIRYNACGEPNLVGTAEVYDWLWSPGFAQRSGPCPPMPPAELTELGTLTSTP